MESFEPHERKVALNRVVGGDEESQNDLFEFSSSDFAEQKFFSHEVEKSDESIRTIEAIGVFMNQFIQEYGGEPLLIKPELIHFIDDEKTPIEDDPKLFEHSDGHFDQIQQHILIRLRTDDTFLTVAEKIVHEIIHAYSFNSISLKVATTETEEGLHKNFSIDTRRVGLLMKDKNSGEEYLNSLNEAITVELEKAFAKRYFKLIPDLKENIELKEKRISSLLDEDPSRKEIFDDTEDIILEPIEGEDGYTWRTHAYAYQKEREQLNLLITDIFENTTEFTSKGDVFRIFTQAYMTGKILNLARLINKVYKNRPVLGIETEETMDKSESRKPFSILAEATKAKAPEGDS